MIMDDQFFDFDFVNKKLPFLRNLIDRFVISECGDFFTRIVSYQSAIGQIFKIQVFEDIR